MDAKWPICVSLGPGGREYVTEGVLEVLREAQLVYLPFTEHGGSRAGDILTDLFIPPERIRRVLIPMEHTQRQAEEVYASLAEEIVEATERRCKIAIATLGDVSVYSTAYVLAECLMERGVTLQLLPGVPSFVAAASLFGISLASRGGALHVHPGRVDLSTVNAELTRRDVVVIMKLSRFTGLPALFASYRGKANFYYAENIGDPDRQVLLTDVELIAKREIPYFSLLIVKMV